ncbi:lysozyme C-like isoform X2 [Hippoglossus hippoglossus]|uniref:lysozyme C-like isoform X2 n=1 Tax=Hippoglossus hippoglossus TaxID=8267 RepID=UPI00148BC3E2|nr:lysozyme C-like isoform X2 [Hippoglossus hippoglossus]
MRTLRRKTAKPKGDEDEVDVEEGGERRKRALRPSFGLYGLFQLSDIHFCDSGYRLSKNRCNTSCTAFTDDDIKDDIKCLVKSRYWRELVRKASRSCRGYKSYNFLKECQ